MGALEKVPGVQNWIERLPAGMRAAWNASIIYRTAKHLHFERGMPVGKAIATAINWCRSTVASGDIKNWPGKQNVNAGSLAEMVAALALWDSMKAYAHAHKGKG
jgi:hypothetical protein